MAAVGGAAAVAEPLDKLQSCINTVLVNIGRTFRDSSRTDIKAPIKARPPRSEAISTAATQFHYALDEIEMELTKAREVLNRDLVTQRTLREEREQAHALANAPPPPIDAVPTPVSLNGPNEPQTLSMGQLMSGGANSTNATKPSPKTISGAKLNGIIPASTSAPSAAAHTLPVTNPPGAATSSSSAQQNATSTANDEFDFEQMFGTTTTNPTDDAFDLDFSAGDMGADMGGLGADPFGDTAMSVDVDAFGGLGGGTDGAGDPIESFLPGLGDMIGVDDAAGGGGGGSGSGAAGNGASAGDAFGGVDLTGGAGAAVTNGNSGADAGTEQQKSAEGPGAGEANGLGITTGGDTTMGGTDADMDDFFGDMLNDFADGGSDLGNMAFDDLFTS